MCISPASRHVFTCLVLLSSFSLPRHWTSRKKRDMAGLLPSSPHPSFISMNQNTLRLSSLGLPLPSLRNPRLSHFPPPASGKARRIRVDRSSGGGDDAKPSPRAPRIPDEWGERSQLEAESPSAADPPKDDDEWGREKTPAGAKAITDEWGEKAEPEMEEPAKPDPPLDEDEDEWGNGTTTAPEEVNVGDLKRCLVDTFYGTELGFRASSEVRAEIVELVSRLEAQNPTPAPNDAPELLDGNWILLYTAFSELLPLIAVGATPFFKIKKISQTIDSKNQTVVNATTLASPFATFSFSASASLEVQSPSRIQVQFKEGAFQPPEVSSTLNLPEKLEIFGQKIDLQPVERSFNPIQQFVANIARGISGQPPLKIPIPGNRAKSWLLTTYLDKDFRISRGDGGLFVLAKDGSPLLDQLS